MIIQRLLLLLATKTKRQRGFTLLEYCAGAALICGIVWGAMETFGTGMEGFWNALSDWIVARTPDVGSS